MKHLKYLIEILSYTNLKHKILKFCLAKTNFKHRIYIYTTLYLMQCNIDSITSILDSIPVGKIKIFLSFMLKANSTMLVTLSML
jgi:hypothetical protein